MNKMKVVFLTGMLNHHQRAFSESMLELCEYRLIATEDTMGAGYQKPMEADYVVHWYKDEEKDFVRKLISEADVAIFGSCPTELIEMRMKENKLSFLYAERYFKKGTWRRFIPKIKKAIQNKVGQYKDKNMYVLCASAYLPYDLSFFGFPSDKCFKWGYFPETKKYGDVDKLIENKKPNSIVWVARFIKLKHPEIMVQMAEFLNCQGYEFNINMIGDGPEKPKIESLIKKKRLTDKIHLLGSMSPEQVREQMERSEIFVFSSDRREGWGAVMNESMNSACVTVASSAPGAPPFLIKEEKNGFIYKHGNEKELCKKIAYLLDNADKRRDMCKNAYENIRTKWNAENASERLIALFDALLNGKRADLYDEGPCSKAKILKDNWR